MIVFHGTSRYAGVKIIEKGPRFPLSTSTEFQIAQLFAMRRSPPEVLRGMYDAAGMVLEFDILSDSGWKPHREPGTLQDEHEIIIGKRCDVKLLAVWKLNTEGEFARAAMLDLTCPAN